MIPPYGWHRCHLRGAQGGMGLSIPQVPVTGGRAPARYAALTGRCDWARAFQEMLLPGHVLPRMRHNSMKRRGGAVRRTTMLMVDRQSVGCLTIHHPRQPPSRARSR